MQTLYPDYVDEGAVYAENKAFNYPRPQSAPPSPRSTPAASLHGSDDEDEDSVDEEQELHELGLNHAGREH